MPWCIHLCLSVRICLHTCRGPRWGAPLQLLLLLGRLLLLLLLGCGQAVQHVCHAEAPAPSTARPSCAAASPAKAQLLWRQATCAAAACCCRCCCGGCAAWQLPQQRLPRAHVVPHADGCCYCGSFILVCCNELHCILLQQVAVVLVHLHKIKSSSSGAQHTKLLSIIAVDVSPGSYNQ
jgi:hypothetical protein